jgi:hypothetical protein
VKIMSLSRPGNFYYFLKKSSARRNAGGTARATTANEELAAMWGRRFRLPRTSSAPAKERASQGKSEARN